MFTLQKRNIRASSSLLRFPSLCSVDQINQEPRRKYWATRLSVCLFACTAQSFACSILLAWLARSASLTRSLACSLCSNPCLCESEWFDDHFFSVFFFLFWTIVLCYSVPLPWFFSFVFMAQEWANPFLLFNNAEKYRLVFDHVTSIGWSCDSPEDHVIFWRWSLQVDYLRMILWGWYSKMFLAR